MLVVFSRKELATTRFCRRRLLEFKTALVDCRVAGQSRDLGIDAERLARPQRHVLDGVVEHHLDFVFLGLR